MSSSSFSTFPCAILYYVKTFEMKVEVWDVAAGKLAIQFGQEASQDLQSPVKSSGMYACTCWTLNLLVPN